MRVIGIDPGTGILGFAVVDFSGNNFKVIDGGVITTPAKTDIAIRLEDIFDNLMLVIDQTKPNVMAIEKLFFSRNVTTAMTVAEARGVAVLAARKNKLEVVEYTPQQIKQSVTGYGKADKKQVQTMVKIQLNLQSLPKPDDYADALAVAITHKLSTRV